MTALSTEEPLERASSREAHPIPSDDVEREL